MKTKERNEKVMENKMKLEFINESCNERFARMTAVAFAAVLEPTVAEIAEIKTAVSEAVTNAIIHGYENSEGIVTMEGEIHDNEVVFVISGTATFHYDDSVEEVRAGQVHYCPMNHAHYMENLTDHDLVYLAIVPEHH